MSRLFQTWLVVLIAGIASAAPPAKDGAFKNAPELEALHNYVGSWDVVVSSGPTPVFLGEATAEWILDGRYVQQTASLRAQDGKPGFKFTTIMTYDSAKRVYRSWTFMTTGSRSESEGIWDAKSRTMVWTSHKDDAGNSSTTKADFSMAGIEKVKIVLTGPSGAVVSELNAENRRRK